MTTGSTQEIGATSTAQSPRFRGEAREAADRLLAEVAAGLRHGFFDIAISGEVIKGGKRGLTIRSGRSFRFVVSEADLQ